MFDPAAQTFLIVAAPPAGYMYTHPVALQPRTEPNATDPTAVDTTLASQGLGLLEVRSIYDTDGLGRMGDAMLTAADLPAGCSTAIAKTTPVDPLDTRAQVADIVKHQEPGRRGVQAARRGSFIRAVRAVAPPSGMTGMRSAIGETEFEMQQILGYAPIEPDGSFKLTVPADTPIGLAVVDAKGRAFQTHTNWIQVRPGERRTCDGCHSPRRGGAINSGAVVNALPAALNATLAAAHQSGETMAVDAHPPRPDGAQARQRHDVHRLLGRHDEGRRHRAPDDGLEVHRQCGRRRRPEDSGADERDHQLPDAHRAASGPRDRGANTCTNCHNDPDKLDLAATIGGAEPRRLVPGADGRRPGARPRHRPAADAHRRRRDRSSPAARRWWTPRRAKARPWACRGKQPAGRDHVGPEPDDRCRLAGGASEPAERPRPITRRCSTRPRSASSPSGSTPAASTSTTRSTRRPTCTLRSASSETVFDTKIYPILMSTCAAACHQAVGSSMTGGAGRHVVPQQPASSSPATRRATTT